jgi:dTDP-glucose 4,6-dehydratase
MTLLVTGGAGFIGSNFILDWLSQRERRDEAIVNLDKLTYAGNLANLEPLQGDPRHVFVKGDICDEALVGRLLSEHRVRAVVHFAAESHVDRSIHGPAEFVRTNVVGTFALLEQARAYWQALGAGRRESFRFLHVSTDEVYGSLGPEDPAFSETTPYAPNSPYSASKAGADHLVRAYRHTYGMPVLTTNCSNNYGPLQFPEKLIPVVLLNALEGKPLPVYGDGKNVRDWLYVGDHCEALRLVLERGVPGETYNIGGAAERTNLEVVRLLCALLDRLAPAATRREELIRFVTDRPGHDRRYAMDTTKIARELGWKPRESFESGMERTVRWYLDHLDWVRAVRTGEYTQWMQRNYAAR